MADEFISLGDILDDFLTSIGDKDMDMRRDRPYVGQPHTDTGERGKTEIKGITFRDLHDCFIRAWCLCAGDQFPELRDEALKGEAAALCPNDIYKIDANKLDALAICQNLACEVERIMGIFPNVPTLYSDDDEPDAREGGR